MDTVSRHGRLQGPPMGQEHLEELTVLIKEAQRGGKAAMDRLFGAIYGEFHRIAETLMGRERPGHTLQPSALVDEAVLRMLNGNALEKAPNRKYLFGVATRAMRQALVDHHRKRSAREGRRKRLPLDDVLAYFEERNVDIAALSTALDRLTELDE